MKYITTITMGCLFLIALAFTSPLTITINGMVTDETGEPLIGATILVAGEKGIGVASEFDGSFSIEVPQLPTTLVVSYIGFNDKEIEVADASRTFMVLMSEGLDLDEVVVTGLGIRKSKKALGYGSTTISAQQLSNQNSNNYNSGRVQKRGRNITRPTFDSQNHYSETESYPSYNENTFKRPLDEALSTFSIDVDRASYSNIRRFIKAGQLPPQEAVRIEEMINYFEYDYPQPKGDTPIAIQSTLTDCPWNEDHQLLHIGLQGKRIPSEHLPPSNFVFLIDVSGSMSDFNKLPLIKSSMKLLLDQLRPTDRVAIVTYAGADQVVLKSTAASDRYAILEAIENLDSGGSTAGAKGIQTAYKIARANFMEDGNNRIILATDGDFNVGINSNDGLKAMIEKERKSGVFLSILGYGMGNYQEDLMQTLAQAGNGNHAYIDDLQEAQKTLIHEFGGTLLTIAKDVKIQVEFNPGNVSAYRLVGYETRMLAKEDFNNDKKDAGDMGSGHAVTAIYEIIPVGSNSKYFGNVDELKYQQKQKESIVSKSDDIATIKFRYKQPNSNTSKKVEVEISEYTASKDLNDNVNWAIATTSFGMKLRHSDFLDDLSYEEIISLAKRARGSDNEGYRAEMIRLMKSARALSSEYLASNK